MVRLFTIEKDLQGFENLGGLSTITGLIIILMTISFSTSMAQNTAMNPDVPASGENPEEYLVRLHTELMEQYVLHHNIQPYADATMDDYLLVVEIGLIETREEVLSTVENLDMKSISLTNEEFLHYGDTVVLIGTMELDGSILDHTVTGKVRYMSVFINHDGKWKMLSGSFSPVVHPSVLYEVPEGHWDHE